MENQQKVEKSYRAMGGQFTFMCYPQNFHTVKEVLTIFDAAFTEVKRIEDKFTDFKESPFNQINKLAGVKPCKVDQEIFDLVQIAQGISEKSNGLFDISYASVGHAWRNAKNLGLPFENTERKKLREFVDYKKIVMDSNECSIYLPYPEMRIGLGGIGKGYAVDCAFKVLKEAGLYNFYVNGSGDIRVHSSASAPRMWKIGIRNPLSSDPSKSVGVIQMANGAVATSGGYVHKVKNSDEKPDHHIVDPETGRSRDGIIASTILADNCLESDTAATVVMNLSGDEGREYLNQNELFGVVINREGETFLSQKAQKSFGI
ncbi:MAG: FAD:protein FMN transferase [Halobacteriovoraceae bacterium]|nr:FAD:protein FMN transferase [Halobacteriovoraceae bacterium]